MDYIIAMYDKEHVLLMINEIQGAKALIDADLDTVRVRILGLSILVKPLLYSLFTYISVLYFIQMAEAAKRKNQIKRRQNAKKDRISRGPRRKER